MSSETPSIPPGRGTTIGGPNSHKKSDILALEYCSFRIPFEELNVIFRLGQKDVDRTANQVAKAAALLTQKVANATTPIEKAALRKNLDYLLKQVRDAKRAMNESCSAQVEQIDKMITRTERIHEEYEISDESSPRVAAKMERQQHGRYMVWHLLRCGYVRSARTMARELDIEGLIDIDVFEKVHEIEQSLLTKNTQPCLDWIERHRSKLRKLGSRLEVAVRQQDVVEMVEAGSIPEAVQYVRRFLTPIAKEKFPEELKKIMGTIACPLEESRKRNPELHADDRWERLAQHYMNEVYTVYDWSSQTALTSLLQTGISVFKTPLCKPDTSKPPNKIKCFVCRPDIWPLAEPLPYARVDNSRILCSMTGDLCDDDENIPFMFPSGHVFGKKSVEKLRRSPTEIYDPVNKKIITDAEVLRLYFL